MESESNVVPHLSGSTGQHWLAPINRRIRAVRRPLALPLGVLQTRRLIPQLVVFQAAAVRNQNPSPVNGSTSSDFAFMIA